MLTTSLAQIKMKQKRFVALSLIMIELALFGKTGRKCSVVSYLESSNDLFITRIQSGRTHGGNSIAQRATMLFPDGIARDMEHCVLAEIIKKATEIGM